MIERITERISGILVAAACVALLLMMLHVCADVAGKYIFNHPVEGTPEIVEVYYMVMVVVLPFAYVTQGDGQIKVELFTRGLSKRQIAGLDALVGIVTLLFMILMTWKTGQEAIAKMNIGEVREVGDGTLISWPGRWFLPAGCGVMAVAVAIRIVKDFKISWGRN